MWFGTWLEDLGRNSAAERQQLTTQDGQLARRCRVSSDFLGAGGPLHLRGFVGCKLGKGVSSDAQSAADGRGLGRAEKTRLAILTAR